MPDEIEFLVVGLGNPGEEYEFTPHNLGFLVIDRLAASHAIRVSRKENTSLVGLGKIAGKRVALAKPQTYMNLSGPAVRGLLERYELKPGRLIVVYDELDLPWGTLRIRLNGSAAGHKGVKSVIGSLGTGEFTRVRLGIHPGNPVEGEKFVLAPFKRAQKQDVEETVNRAAEAVESIIAEGAAQAMTKFNAHKRQSAVRDEGSRAQGLPTEEE